MPANFNVNLTSTAAVATMTQQGGSGTSENPFQWSRLESKPDFALIRIHTYKVVAKGNKGVDKIVHKYRVPYTVVNSTTSQEEEVSYCSATVTYELPRNVPQSVVDTTCYLVASAECWDGAIGATPVSANLLLYTSARQAG